MRFSPLVLASGAAALAIPECLTSSSSVLAGFSECANHSLLNFCLAHLQDTSIEKVTSCYQESGCSADDALLEARASMDRCEDWARASELRRRSRIVPSQPEKTASPVLDADTSAFTAVANLNFLFGRQDSTSSDGTLECYVTSTVSTKLCSTSTSKGILKAHDCKETEVALSECASGLTCSMDSQGQDVCMKLHNALDIAGIIIAIVFGSALVLSIGSLTFLCCKDRKEQKRLAAKAEATALARAATKKKKAADAAAVRAPLMRHQDSNIPTVQTPTGMTQADPFGDHQQRL